MLERLQKIIANAGIASRRKSEEFITTGRVSVNGEIITTLGSKADIASDLIRVDGKPLKATTERRYIAVNKPKGYVTTTSDPEGRRTVMELLDKRIRKGMYPVGRLDYNTEGLLLLTNDGDFANHILSSKSGITKTYHVKVSGTPSPEQINRLRRGVMIDGRLAAPESIRPLRSGKNPWYEVDLAEGRNRQIHKMFQNVGILVEKIRRVRIGPLVLGTLKSGQARELRARDIKRILAPAPTGARPSRRPVPRSSDRQAGPSEPPKSPAKRAERASTSAPKRRGKRPEAAAAGTSKNRAKQPKRAAASSPKRGPKRPQDARHDRPRSAAPKRSKTGAPKRPPRKTP